MHNMWPIIVSAVAASILVLVSVPPLRTFCHRYGYLDRPGARRIHTTPTPRLTGIAFFGAFWCAVLIIGWTWPERLADLKQHAFPVFAGSLIVALLGIVDDLRPLPGYAKLGAEIVAFVPLWLSGIGFDRLWIPFIGGVDLGFWSLPVSLLWFLALVNAVNVIDGVDGLATATSAVVALTLIWITWTLNLKPLTILSAVILGALAGFWRYNRPPASVFMGDTGALFLGYLFAVIALLAPIKRFTALTFFVPLIAMLLPLGESALSVVRRTISGRNPIRADVGHLHHMLLAAGWNPDRVVAAYAAVTAVFGAFCIGFHYVNRRLLTVALAFFVLLLGGALAIFLNRNRAEGGNTDYTQSAGEE